MSPAEIRRAEALMAEGWPPAETLRLAGWTCGFDAGVTRRANCVLPLDHDGTDLASALEAAEAAYAVRGLPPVFKLGPGARPDGLDAALAARGYRTEGHARVLGRPLAGAETDPGLPVAVTDTPDPAWSAIVNGAGPDRSARDAIVARIRRPRLVATTWLDGRPAAGGLGVVLDELLLVTALVTRPQARRRGAARALLAALARAATARGLDRLILQVEADNAPAAALYDRLGWHELYRYAYRVAPAAT